MTQKSAHASRRQFLKALGLSAALAPFVPLSVTKAANAAAPKRLIIYWTPNGLLHSEYKPDGGETDFTLRKILAPLEKYRSKLLHFQNLEFAAFKKYPIENNHDPAYMGLTGARLVNKSGSGMVADGPSVDQAVAQRLGRPGSFDGLVLGVEAYAPLFYRQAQQQVDALLGPKNIWKALFSATLPNAKDWAALDRKSVIDVVRPQLLALEGQVGSDARAKVEAHLDHLRTLELRLQSAANCSAASSAPTTDPLELAERGRLTLELMALALKCDLTRVASFAWFGPGGAANFVYDWLRATGRHHDLSHAGPVTPDRQEYDSLTKIGAFFATQLVAFLDQLAAVEEDGSTLLDNSLVLWTSEHPGNHPMYGDHGRTDVPYTLIGSGGGYFKTGRNLDMSGKSNNQLLLSLIHGMGFEDATTFGEAELCPGPLPGLT